LHQPCTYPYSIQLVGRYPLPAWSQHCYPNVWSMEPACSKGKGSLNGRNQLFHKTPKAKRLEVIAHFDLRAARKQRRTGCAQLSARPSKSLAVPAAAAALLLPPLHRSLYKSAYGAVRIWSALDTSPTSFSTSVAYRTANMAPRGKQILHTHGVALVLHGQDSTKLQTTLCSNMLAKQGADIFAEPA